MATKRIFFATDLHGSDLCYRKFLAARAFYEANIMILGGDITGKSILPIVATQKGYRASLYGHEHQLASESELREFENKAHSIGAYTVRLSADELAELSHDDAALKMTEASLIRERLERWIDLADRSGENIYFCPGNDDAPAFDSLFQQAASFIWIDREHVQLEGGLHLVGFGGSNRTPWSTAREFDENQIRDALNVLSSTVTDPDRTLCSIHVPPFNSGLDLCPEITSSLQVRLSPGAVSKRPVGSPSVSEFIQRTQPLLSLFGHIHEARGTVRIGQTLCINPGSTFYEGSLAGALIDIHSTGLGRVRLTSG
jgi:uncharacterized protein